MKPSVASRLEPSEYIRKPNLQIGLAMGSDTLDIDFALKFKHSPARVFRQVSSPTSCGRRITLLAHNYSLEGNREIHRATSGLPHACTHGHILPYEWFMNTAGIEDFFNLYSF